MDRATIEPVFNPARRLHELSTQFLEGLNNKISVLDRWSQVLGLQGASRGTVLHAYSEVVRLPEKTRAILQTLDEPPDHKAFQLEALPAYEKLFAGTHLNQNCTPYQQHITGEVLAKLNTAAMAIERHHGYSSESIRDNVEAAKEVRDALDDIRRDAADDPDLDPEVRSYLLKNLARLTEALSLYAVDGISPTIDALDAVNGQDSRMGDVAERAQATPYLTRIKEAVGLFKDLAIIATQLGLPFAPQPALAAPDPTPTDPPPAIAPATPDDEQREP